MVLPRFYIKTTILSLLAWLPLLLFSKPLLLESQEGKDPISLIPFFTVIEDVKNTFTADELYWDSSGFVPLSQLKLNEPDQCFWLRANIQTSADLDQRYFSILFNYLTFVDLYLYLDDQLLIHKKAGAFREKQFIEPGDSRFAFNVKLKPSANYTLLIKVGHIKKYAPNYDFVLHETITSLTSKHNFDLANSFLLGAIIILLLYILMLWLSYRYRPYLWLLLFMLGIALYSFALRPVFIDTFFSERPETGWLMIFPFLHLGVIGFYLLMIDFLGMEKNAPRLYHYSLNLVKIVIAFSAISITYNSLTGNYYITNKINLLFAPIHLVYIIYILIHLRKKLNAAQHYLVYGILLFGFAVAFLTVNSFLFQEQSLMSASIVAKSTILCISLLFLVGLHKQLQQHDQERIVVLEQLNDMHLQYNTTIEKKVRERTLKLKNTNAKLVEQQVQLIEKNRHIEILIDELNHRVKNNLQMLYSLNTLQLPLIKDNKSKQILNEMRGRIKAMMLVNEHLHAYKSNQSVTLSAFINEIVNHLQQIYDHNRNIKIKLVLPEDLQFSSLKALPFGLLLTELLTNAYKHAFAPTQPNPQINISLFELENKIRFIFEDNGQGAEAIFKDTSMGISLIQDLTRQLKGTITLQHNNGLSYLFIFSNAKHYAHINY